MRASLAGRWSAPCAAPVKWHCPSTCSSQRCAASSSPVSSLQPGPGAAEDRHLGGGAGGGARRGRCACACCRLACSKRQTLGGLGCSPSQPTAAPNLSSTARPPPPQNVQASCPTARGETCSPRSQTSWRRPRPCWAASTPRSWRCHGARGACRPGCAFAGEPACRRERPTCCQLTTPLSPSPTHSLSLTLCSEVLVMVMRKHQRYFPVCKPQSGAPSWPAETCCACPAG